MFFTKKNFVLLIILFLAGLLRFYNLTWGFPFFFNPDERNMATAITELRLPGDLSQIPLCLIGQISPISSVGDGDCNLNPHFFAYGQFPLYLAFVSDQAFKLVLGSISSVLSTNFPSAIFWLRFWSAVFSILTVLMVYLITRKLFTNSNSHGFPRISSQISTDPRKSVPLSVFIPPLLAAFTPGLIQSAHFGTTESILTFLFLFTIFLSLKLFDPKKHSLIKFALLNSLVLGLAVGIKVSSIVFTAIPLFSALFYCFETLEQKPLYLKRIVIFLLFAILLLFLTGLFFAVSSPYNLIDWTSFKSAVFGYESDVARGTIDVFYTRQFINTTPIVFQLQKIFPYALGWPIFISGILGFIWINFQLILDKLQRHNPSISLRVKDNLSLWILDFGFIFYFLPNSFLFVKWTRFMTPVLPIFSIFSAFFLFQMYNFFINLSCLIQKSKIKNQNYNSNLKTNVRFKFLVVVLSFEFCVLSFIPGIAYLSIYSNPDTRIQASEWIYENIPTYDEILSETANVYDLPLPTTENLEPRTKNYNVIPFNFYDLDENPELFDQLINNLTKSDYILVPSRRIFANYLRLPEKYPLVNKYYNLLFSGKLGFEEVKKISSFSQFSIFNFPSKISDEILQGKQFSIPDESAEETWSVFDHPVVRIYKKSKSFTKYEYEFLFKQ